MRLNQNQQTATEEQLKSNFLEPSITHKSKRAVSRPYSRRTETILIEMVDRNRRREAKTKKLFKSPIKSGRKRRRGPKVQVSHYNLDRK